MVGIVVTVAAAAEAVFRNKSIHPCVEFIHLSFTLIHCLLPQQTNMLTRLACTTTIDLSRNNGSYE